MWTSSAGIRSPHRVKVLRAHRLTKPEHIINPKFNISWSIWRQDCIAIFRSCLQLWYSMPTRVTSRYCIQRVSSASRCRVAEKYCPPPPDLSNAVRVCDSTYKYSASCSYKAAPGYELPSGGTTTIKCTEKYVNDDTPVMVWDEDPTPNVGRYH